MTAALYWKTALPYYLEVSFRLSTLGWVGPLAITLASTMWLGLTKHRLAVNRTGMEFDFAFGGFFFLLTLLGRLWATTCAATGVHKSELSPGTLC